MKKPKNSVYDGKALWEYYMGMGVEASHRKLIEWATKQGMVSPDKTTASRMGPFWAMWRYALRHPEEAFPAYKQWMFETDKFHRSPLFEEFLMDVAHHARKGKSIVSEGTLRAFREKYRV